MRRLPMIILIVCIAAALLALAGYLVLQQPVFGSHPKGERLRRVQRSAQYRNGNFENASETPMMTDGSLWEAAVKYVSPSGVPTEPPKALPSVRTNLRELVANADPQKPVVVWFGHSSYLVRIAGITLLIDPVLSERASPFSFAGVKRYEGTGVYGVADLPPIDAVIITHDHYDHLDYPTVLQLKAQTNHFHVALGVGAHLEHWGVDAAAITEYDWWERGTIAPQIELIAAPARHFSGRGLVRNSTLWVSFVLKTPQHTLYLGGDSGYDTHFRAIGDKYGPFDLALLECGQYNTSWKLIHLMPEEVVQASQDLRATVLMPVHWGKFTLALHSFDEPVRRLTAEADKRGLRLATPMIGEPVIVDSLYPAKRWWEGW